MVVLAAAGTYPLAIERGATLYRRFVWELEGEQGAVTPVDLTGCTARAQIRLNHKSTTVAYEMAPVVVDPADGVIDITIPDEATAGMLFTTAVWDLEIAWQTGEVTRLLEGPVAVSPEVTRA